MLAFPCYSLYQPPEKRRYRENLSDTMIQGLAQQTQFRARVKKKFFLGLTATLPGGTRSSSFGGASQSQSQAEMGTGHSECQRSARFVISLA